MYRDDEDPASSEEVPGSFIKNLDAHAVLRTMHQPLIVLDSGFIVQGANRAFYNTFKVEPGKAEGLAFHDLGNGQWDIPKLRELLSDILPNKGIVDDFKIEHRFETIGRRIMKINARQIREEDSELILLVLDDITDQEDLRWELEGQRELASKIMDAVPVPFLVLGEDLRVQKANGTFYDTFRVDRDETEGRLVYELGNNQWDIPKLRNLLEDVLPHNNTFDNFEVEHNFEDIGHRTMMLNARRIDHQQLILLAIDLTKQRALEREQIEDADNRSFILNLFDRLREEKEPDVLVEVTCQALGRRLDADLVFYADIGESDESANLPHLWSRKTIPEPTGRRQVGDFGHLVRDHMKEAETLVIENVHADARIQTPGPSASFGDIPAASLVHVPLMEGGELRSVLGVQVRRPRQWTPADVRLTEEVAERLRDAVARCRAEAELRTSHETFRVLVESDAQATWETAPDGRSTHSTASWRAYTGQTEEEELGEGWLNAIHPDDREAFALRWPQHLQAQLPFSEEYRLRHGDGWRWSKLRAAPVRDSVGRIVRWVGMNHDITHRKEVEKRIEHMALYDALTGLPNRTLLQDRFREAAARTEREGGNLGLFMLDVDRFKEVNDTVGHAGGDKLLRCVADRVSHALRSSDTFARLSGDEFVAVLPHVESVAEIERLAERIRSAVSQPLILDEQVITLSVSMGIVVFPQDGEELEPLLHCADIALYRAKAGGRDAIRFFEPEMEAEAQRLRRTEADLRTALERGELTLFYQPQLDLSGGRIRSVEALVRWRHPTRGLLSPDNFIPVAESTGLIHLLDRWVLDAACRQVREWRDEGLDLSVSINISAAEARLNGILETLDKAFSAYGLRGGDVEIELTETLLDELADEPVARLLAGLRERGIRVALDDFGTGYSSLSYLTDLPIDTIKIDRSFISGTNTGDGRILLGAMIDLGHKLGKRIIVEGVETDDQLAWLMAAGCDAVQGFRIARPTPPDEVPMNVS